MRILYGFVAGFLLAASATMAAQSASAIDPPSKLTAVLAALAGAVPQDDASVAAQRVTPGARLSQDVSALPASVQDAIRSRRLRINDANEVQVYILGAVNAENIGRLTASGVTIEIQDAARRRVQARVPASRLQAIASLPFVDFIRLPTYARHRAGLFTTEGDKVLHADVARQQ